MNFCLRNNCHSPIDGRLLLVVLRTEETRLRRAAHMHLWRVDELRVELTVGERCKDFALVLNTFKCKLTIAPHVRAGGHRRTSPRAKVLVEARTNAAHGARREL